MLDHRLTSPPRERTLSIGALSRIASTSEHGADPWTNGKLSGAFLLASRLRATVDCRKLWDGVVGDYTFSTSPSLKNVELSRNRGKIYNNFLLLNRDGV